MSASKAVVLQGVPTYNENGVASENGIIPGMLVQGVTTIAKHNVAGGVAARTFALERDEMGDALDVAYVIGDVVKVGSFSPGDVVNAVVASGANIAAGSFVESAGNGAVRVYAAGTRIGRAVETQAAAPATRLAIEIY
jgi:hypothetical protein